MITSASMPMPSSQSVIIRSRQNLYIRPVGRKLVTGRFMLEYTTGLPSRCTSYVDLPSSGLSSRRKSVLSSTVRRAVGQLVELGGDPQVHVGVGAVRRGGDDVGDRAGRRARRRADDEWHPELRGRVVGRREAHGVARARQIGREVEGERRLPAGVGEVVVVEVDRRVARPGRPPTTSCRRSTDTPRVPRVGKLTRRPWRPCGPMSRIVSVGMSMREVPLGDRLAGRRRGRRRTSRGRSSLPLKHVDGRQRRVGPGGGERQRRAVERDAGRRFERRRGRPGSRATNPSVRQRPAPQRERARPRGRRRRRRRRSRTVDAAGRP